MRISYWSSDVCSSDLIPWRESKPFDIRRFNELRTALLETGLFSTVRIRGADTVPADGVLPIAISLTERKSRTVTAGVSYQTEEGPRVEASWEHRNLFGRGESLRIGAAVSAITTALETDRSEEHTSELQSLMRISYAVFCLKKKTYT